MMVRYHVTNTKTSFAGPASAEAHAREASRRHPATQIGVYTSFAHRAGRKYVCVYLNGHKLPRSAWFAGYK